MSMADDRPRNTTVKNENYFQVSGWMINELHLKGAELCVYAIIYGFSQSGEYQFTGSKQYLADFVGVTKRAIIGILANLVKKGVVEKQEVMNGNVKRSYYKALLPSEKSSLVKNLHQCNLFTGTSEKFSPNNKVYNKEKKIQKEKTSFSFDARVFENLKDRVNKLFNRRSSTAWSEKETKQLNAVAKREGVLEELTEIETLYNSGYEYKRRDVITFLNNFSTELDRARSRNQEVFPNQGETSSEAEPMYKAGRDYAVPAPIAGRETPVRSSADMPLLNFREDENV